MKTENAVLMQQARESLEGKWNKAAGVTFVYMLIGIVLSSIKGIGPLINMIIMAPLELGYIIYFLSLSRKEDVQIELLFKGFNKFWLAFRTFWLMAIFVLLWAVLLIIPGIIAGMSYSMSFFIIVDDPSLNARQAINKSKELMVGNIWKFFCLNLRFLGWAILAALSFGIGFLWLLPYMRVSYVKFYEELLIEKPHVMKARSESVVSAPEDNPQPIQ